MKFNFDLTERDFLMGVSDPQRISAFDIPEQNEEPIPIVSGEELIRDFARRRRADASPEADRDV